MPKLKDTSIAKGTLVLELYVAGMTPKSMAAIENIKRLCAENIEGAFELEIIDLYKNPGLASERQIVFSPTLVKILPLPRSRLIGTFANNEKVIKGLGIRLKESE